MDLKTNPAFSHPYSEGLVHQVVTAYLTGARQGTKAQKTRSEVSGGGAKPWRQKGTGRARAGTTRGPLWRTGGVTFAAKPRNHKQKVNRKMYRKAMAVILSELIRTDRLVVSDELTLTAPKTKELASKLEKLAFEGRRLLIITEEFDKNLALASRNLPNVYYCEHKDVNPVSLISHDKIIVTSGYIKKAAEVLS